MKNTFFYNKWLEKKNIGHLTALNLKKKIKYIIMFWAKTYFKLRYVLN